MKSRAKAKLPCRDTASAMALPRRRRPEILADREFADRELLTAQRRRGRAIPRNATSRQRPGPPAPPPKTSSRTRNGGRSTRQSSHRRSATRSASSDCALAPRARFRGSGYRHWSRRRGRARCRDCIDRASHLGSHRRSADRSAARAPVRPERYRVRFRRRPTACRDASNRSITPEPMLPAPQTTIWPRRWIGRRPCIVTHCTRVSSEAPKAMNRPVKVMPDSISSIAATTSTGLFRSGVTSPYPVVVIVATTK